MFARVESEKKMVYFLITEIETFYCLLINFLNVIFDIFDDVSSSLLSVLNEVLDHDLEEEMRKL